MKCTWTIKELLERQLFCVGSFHRCFKLLTFNSTFQFGPRENSRCYTHSKNKNSNYHVSSVTDIFWDPEINGLIYGWKEVEKSTIMS